MSERKICPNCGQWQEESARGYLDCMNECAKRGFARCAPLRGVVEQIREQVAVLQVEGKTGRFFPILGDEIPDCAVRGDRVLCDPESRLPGGRLRWVLTGENVRR